MRDQLKAHIAASAYRLPQPERASFDAVKVTNDRGESVVLFLPVGTGQSVADAINEAIGGDAE